jgi:hypothetical protein
MFLNNNLVFLLIRLENIFLDSFKMSKRNMRIYNAIKILLSCSGMVGPLHLEGKNRIIQAA